MIKTIKLSIPFIGFVKESGKYTTYQTIYNFQFHLMDSLAIIKEIEDIFGVSSPFRDPIIELRL